MGHVRARRPHVHRREPGGIVWVNVSSPQHGQISADRFSFMRWSNAQILRTRAARDSGLVRRRGSVHSRMGRVVVANEGAHRDSVVPMACACSDANHSTVRCSRRMSAEGLRSSLMTPPDDATLGGAKPDGLVVTVAAAIYDS